MPSRHPNASRAAQKRGSAIETSVTTASRPAINRRAKWEVRLAADAEALALGAQASGAPQESGAVHGDSCVGSSPDTKEPNGAGAAALGTTGESATVPHTPRELARRLYEQSPLPVARVAEMVGIRESSLYRIARREGWRPRKVTIRRDNDGLYVRRFQHMAAGVDARELSPADVVRAFVAPSAEALAAQREAIVARLWKKAEVEIAARDAAAARTAEKAAEREREREAAAREREHEAHLRIWKDANHTLRRLAATERSRKRAGAGNDEQAAFERHKQGILEMVLRSLEAAPLASRQK